jgi:hypothetical protein
MEESVVDRRFTDEEVRSMGSSFKTPQEVKARLGEPIVDFGPQRVFVYQWTVNKGSIFFLWVFGGSIPQFPGFLPWKTSHLLFIAFDLNDKVLKTGTSEFNIFDTIAEEVQDWLSQNSLSTQVVGPRPEQGANRRPLVFVYRPSSSPCSFPTFDSNLNKPSVSVDGHVMGDVEKGKYLSFETSPGTHEITIDPLPYYRSVAGQITFSPLIPTTINIIAELSKPQYIETYICDGSSAGKEVKMYAEIRDAATALQAIHDLHPAW